VIGGIEYAYSEPGETLAEVGARFDIGYDAMVQANPQVEPLASLSSQTRLLIPSQFILPSTPHRGLVINLAEYRLYYFPENDNVVITNPVGIGRRGWSTPLGLTKVVAKQVNPTWHPSAKLVDQAAKDGVLLPNEFPPGPGNPLGKHVLRLGWPTYLIHGTNNANGIGERVSAGCIRMLPDDIEYLFGFVDIGTPVRVINEPVKLGRLAGRLYIEVHPDVLDHKQESLSNIALNQLSHQTMSHIAHQAKLKQELQHPTGIPRALDE
jgi:L,D-transpeptidase ErfK/SrfK